MPKHDIFSESCHVFFEYTYEEVHFHEVGMKRYETLSASPFAQTNSLREAVVFGKRQTGKTEGFKAMLFK